MNEVHFENKMFTLSLPDRPLYHCTLSNVKLFYFKGEPLGGKGLRKQYFTGLLDFQGLQVIEF